MVDAKLVDQVELAPIVTASLQVRSLAVILDRVVKAAGEGKKPVVEIDLDLTSLRPVYRTTQAVKVAARAYDIEELADPTKLPMLPGYTDEAWEAFLEITGLPQRYPKLVWRGPTDGAGASASVRSTFHQAYWTTDWLQEDEPNSGLGAFVRAVEDRGGVVVFISGRWLPEQFEPSRIALRRAGVPEPNLLIGNPRHGDTVAAGQKPLSDAQIKALRQPEIREKYGTPVAVIDDRVANRQAVIDANDDPVLGVGIAIAGFSFDVATASAPARISSFEDFAMRGPDPRQSQFVSARYPDPIAGRPWRSDHQGLGRNGRGYVLPRAADPGLDGARLALGFALPFGDLVERSREGALDVDAFMEQCLSTIPQDERDTIDATLDEARRLASEKKAEPYPDSEVDRRHLRYTLAASWLHARDLEVVMGALGYSLPATGKHDLREDVPVADVKAYVAGERAAGAQYSAWFTNWVEGLKTGDQVNIDFFNPSLTVSIWRWRPDVAMNQDAMDAHRVSAHHEGDGKDRYDPLEAAVNELLHHREGIYGIRKEPVTSWDALAAQMERVSDVEQLAKSSVAIRLLRDALPLLRQLEREGRITPWGLVEGASF
ncbi:hypothetical protein [Polyangium aurulentum]|uniref:hypothetical protein n=1 Tax=Polyangium aurulentum TaxID=2567896 RepID=UPI0010AE67AA|nr:hypothetical protein [Polyangium aurulentum]UQA58369.1 hypothetical protein E8A73_045185 [Polyangium aurulentum]